MQTFIFPWSVKFKAKWGKGSSRHKKEEISNYLFDTQTEAIWFKQKRFQHHKTKVGDTCFSNFQYLILPKSKTWSISAKSMRNGPKLLLFRRQYLMGYQCRPVVSQEICGILTKCKLHCKEQWKLAYTYVQHRIAFSYMKWARSTETVELHIKKRRRSSKFENTQFSKAFLIIFQ